MKHSIVLSKRDWSVALARRPSSPNAWWACESENMSGYTRAPRCSSGIRSDQSPRFPPAIERLRPEARGPVDRVLEDPRHRGVVLGRDDEEGVGGAETVAEARGTGR